MDKVKELKQLEERVRKLKDDIKADRMSRIVDEIEALIQEGIKLSNETGVEFSLSRTSLASQYGFGGLRWEPSSSEWYSSSSSC